MLVILLQEMYICEARQSHKEYRYIRKLDSACVYVLVREYTRRGAKLYACHRQLSVHTHAITHTHSSSPC